MTKSGNPQNTLYFKIDGKLEKIKNIPPDISPNNTQAREVLRLILTVKNAFTKIKLDINKTA